MPSAGERKSASLTNLRSTMTPWFTLRVPYPRCGGMWHLPAKPKEIDYVNACLWREIKDREDARRHHLPGRRPTMTTFQNGARLWIVSFPASVHHRVIVAALTRSISPAWPRSSGRQRS